VIDFRTDIEKKGRADRLVPGAECIDLPITTVDSTEGAEELTKRKAFDVSKIIVLAAFNKTAQCVAETMYASVVAREDCQRQYSAFLREVARTTAGAVLYHCTQGKDRAGFATAFLLAALGADRATIVADFDFTNRVYEKDVRKFCRRVKFLGGKEKELQTVRAFIGANTQKFEQALDWIDATYGSLDAYLRGPLGLTDADINALRTRYLE